MSSSLSVVSTPGFQPAFERAESNRVARERHPALESACPECDGYVVTKRHESYCQRCGLVVSDDHMDLRPSYKVHGPMRPSGPQEWSLEAVNPLRFDKGLHTTFFLGKDGQGNSLSFAQKRKFGRLRRSHRRWQMGSNRKRTIRLNEGLRDIEGIGGNLDLPRYVIADAGRWLREAAVERLPGGHMAWESLAGGAILLAAIDAGVPRESTEVALFTKASHERVCAAARKLRCELELDTPPIRPRAVEEVLETLGEDLDEVAHQRLHRLGEHLLELADETKIGPGTSRLTVAAAAVYAADRLTDGKDLTQSRVVEAASTIVATTKGKVGRYSGELVEAYVDRHGTDDPGVVLKRDPALVG